MRSVQKVHGAGVMGFYPPRWPAYYGKSRDEKALRQALRKPPNLRSGPATTGGRGRDRQLSIESPAPFPPPPEPGYRERQQSPEEKAIEDLRSRIERLERPWWRRWFKP